MDLFMMRKYTLKHHDLTKSMHSSGSFTPSLVQHPTPHVPPPRTTHVSIRQPHLALMLSGGMPQLAAEVETSFEPCLDASGVGGMQLAEMNMFASEI